MINLIITEGSCILTNMHYTAQRTIYLIFFIKDKDLKWLFLKNLKDKIMFSLFFKKQKSFLKVLLN